MGALRGLPGLAGLQRSGTALLTVGALVAAGAATATLTGFGPGSYTVSVTLASATNVVPGAPVLVDGFESGTVRDVELVDGHAVVTMALDDDVAPLHDGAQVLVGWKATLSERLVEVSDGPEGNPEIPDGGMVPGEMPVPTEVDQVLAALDAPTRASLQSLLDRTAGTLEGNEQNLNATLRTAGPALAELGELLEALGTDGPAIENLVTRLNAMIGTLAARDGEVETILASMGELSGEVAARRTELREALVEVPGTLEQADATLSLVPSVADEVVPLLEDLAPATERLAPVAQDLAPLLTDLGPLTEDLRPALGSLAALLELTPGLLDTAHATVPELTTTVDGLADPAAFLRPYTPEVVAFFSTWASMFGNYDANGNFARVQVQAGTTSLNENPGVVPPGLTYDPYPEPGAIVGQGWTDAFGSELQ